MIYHTFPVTLFEHPEAGDLTFDITYKEHRAGRATLNFTCRMAQADEVDSVRFRLRRGGDGGPGGEASTSNPGSGTGNTAIRLIWTLHNSAGSFDETQQPSVTLYIDGLPGPIGPNAPHGGRMPRSATGSSR